MSIGLAIGYVFLIYTDSNHISKMPLRLAALQKGC